MGETMAMMKEKSVPAENLMLSVRLWVQSISAVSAGRLSRQSAREVFAYAFDGGEDIEGYIKAHRLEVVSDDSAYEQILSDVLAGCEKDVAQYRSRQPEGIRLPRRAGDEGAQGKGGSEENQSDAQSDVG